MAENEYRKEITMELFPSINLLLDTYFALYDDLLTRAEAESLQADGPGYARSPPIGHKDVLTGARLLQQNPLLTWSEAVDNLSGRLPNVVSPRSIAYAVLVAVRLMLMLDCSVNSRLYQQWQPSQRYVEFVMTSFPRSNDPSGRVAQALEDRNSLKSWKLKEKGGITIVGTDNLARHLELDLNGPKLHIFHHTTFLRAQRSLVEHDTTDDWEFNLSKGRLPPTLVAETIHSIKEILFPFDDHKSRRILQRLIQQDRFDDDCANLGPVVFDRGQKLEYVYWGERLAALHELRKNRPPRTKFEKWVKWQTTESNAFAVALAALLISILVGILSLGLGAVQVWVAWKAWKEPAKEDSEMVIKIEDLIEWVREQERR